MIRFDFFCESRPIRSASCVGASRCRTRKESLHSRLAKTTQTIQSFCTPRNIAREAGRFAEKYVFGTNCT